MGEEEWKKLEEMENFARAQEKRAIARPFIYIICSPSLVSYNVIVEYLFPQLLHL
jgi:hypothetical protein